MLILLSKQVRHLIKEVIANNGDTAVNYSTFSWKLDNA